MTTHPGQVESRIESPTSARRIFRTSAVLGAGALLLLAFSAYLPAIRAGFIWDDEEYVRQNPVLRTADGLRRIWLEPTSTPQYYPLVFTSFWVEYRLWGLNPAGYHAVNIALHAVNAILLWRLLAGLGLRAAFLAALLFALHPVHVESVAWITERKNVLSGLFYLGSLWCYLRFTGLMPGFATLGEGVAHGQDKLMQECDPLSLPNRARQPRLNSASPAAHLGSPGSRPALFYALSLVLFACALLSKTVTCSLPAAILLILYWKKGRIRWADVVPLLPFFALGLAAGLATAYLEREHVGAEGRDWNLSPIDRCLIAGRALCFYVSKVVWPHPLIFIYPRWTIDSHALWQYTFPLLVIGVMVCLFLLRHRLGRGPLVAACLFAGTLTPALGFFNVYPMRFSFVADHFQYLASIAPIILLASLIHSIRISVWGRGVAAVGALGFAALTFNQCRIYKDAESLWRETLRRNPTAWMAHGNLGKELVDQGRLDEGLEHCRKVLDFRPDLASSHCNLGGALIKAGGYDEAIACLRDALRIKPEHLRSLHDLGYALIRQGKFAESVQPLRRATEIEPSAFPCHHMLAEALVELRRVDEAEKSYRAAIQLRPHSAVAHCGLATLLAGRGRHPEAIQHFLEALAADQKYPEALANLAFSLHAEGRVDESIKCLRKALEVRPNYALARFNLACILQEHGNLPQAAAEFREVLRVNPNDAEAARRLRELEPAATRPAAGP